MLLFIDISSVEKSIFAMSLDFLKNLVKYLAHDNTY